jgi:hypothetical protein
MIYFRSQYRIQELQIRVAAPSAALADHDHHYLEFQVGGPHNVVVSLRNNTEDKAARKAETYLFCYVTCCFEPNPKIRSIFESLVKEQLPSRSKIPPEAVDKYIDDSGALKDIPPLRFLPENIQQFVNQVCREHRTAAERAVDVLRWRAAQLGLLSPISSSRFYWSLDKENWHSFPIFTEASMEVRSFTVPLSTQIRSDMQALIDLKSAEPLGHELFREAWAQLNSPNLRSALVIGVAALEVGVKECVSALVPRAAWIVSEVPSPPVHKMLETYLPSLPAKCTFEGAVLSPPKAISDELRDAIRDRNEVSHRGRAKPLDRTKLKERLLAIRDVLWLLDYYQGHEWALDYVREKTLKMMQGPL